MKLTAIFVFLIMCGMAIGQPTHNSDYSECRSRIRISGETNINSFHLYQVIPDNRIMDLVSRNFLNQENSELMSISIPVKDFIANNKFVYKDFLELINVAKNPDIIIMFDENQVRKMYAREMSEALVGIRLNGVTKYYTITCKVDSCINGKYQIEGVKNLMLTDFKLDPNDKSFGIIKVKNELNVNFVLSMPVRSKFIFSQN